MITGRSLGALPATATSGDWHSMAPGEAGFEDGTVSFLQIPDLESGLSWVNGIGTGQIHQRVMRLTGWLIDRLAALRHDLPGPPGWHHRPRTPTGC